MTRRQITLSLAALLVLSACGDKKDWDEEIIVRVFKPKGVDVGKVTVKATQEGVTKDTTVAGFKDCDDNRVRVIPKQGSSAPLLLTVTNDKGPLPAACVAYPGCNISPPVTSVKVVLVGGSGEWEPKGSCTPPFKPTPDGGPDGQPPKKPTGSPCGNDVECEGGKCISELLNTGTSIPLPGKYCSRSCDNSDADCIAGVEKCYENKDGNGTVKTKVCVKTCVTDGDCGRTGYICSPLNLCIPK